MFKIVIPACEFFCIEFPIDYIFLTEIGNQRYSCIKIASCKHWNNQHLVFDYNGFILLVKRKRGKADWHLVPFFGRILWHGKLTTVEKWPRKSQENTCTNPFCLLKRYWPCLESLGVVEHWGKVLTLWKSSQITAKSILHGFNYIIVLLHSHFNRNRRKSSFNHDLWCWSLEVLEHCVSDYS